MNPTLLRATTAAIVLAAACGNRGPRKPTADELLNGDPLPLAVGATWTYAATITVYDADQDKEVERSLSWVTEVVGARPVGDGVIAYDIKGWPSDLSSAWTDAPQPSTQTLIRSGNSFLWAAPGSAAPAPGAGSGSAATVVSTEPVSLDDSKGWFTWPLRDGQRVCPSPDDVYCWDAEATDEGMRLRYRTGPDEESYLLQPGTGVARYTYQHHGTTNEVTAVLTNYKAGKAAPAPTTAP